MRSRAAPVGVQPRRAQRAKGGRLWGGVRAPVKAMGRLMPCSAIQSISASQRSQLHHVML